MELVLVVDASRESLLSITRDLSGLRLRLMGTGSFSRGLELARVGNPDLILLGIEKSWNSALDFLQSIHSDEVAKGTPVMVITGDSDREKVLLARSLGGMEFIVRPYKVESLRAKVRQMLQRPAKGAAEQKPAEGDLKLVRVGERGYVFLTGRIQPSLEERLDQAFSSWKEEMGIVIFDLRGIHELDQESQATFFRVLKRLPGKEIICVAGRNYGVLFQEGADEMCHLLLSRAELEEYMKMREEGRGSSPSSSTL